MSSLPTVEADSSVGMTFRQHETLRDLGRTRSMVVQDAVRVKMGSRAYTDPIRVARRASVECQCLRRLFMRGVDQWLST
jgi:hypothetical protein